MQDQRLYVVRISEVVRRVLSLSGGLAVQGACRSSEYGGLVTDTRLTYSRVRSLDLETELKLSL